MSVARTIVCFNSGSSSLKYSVFVGMRPVLDGAVERLSAGEVTAALEDVLNRVEDAKLPLPDGIGHRFVHGGPRHFEPELVTDALLADLRACSAFAPLHMPAQLEVVEALSRKLPKTPQVLCFDTGFHRDLPAAARTLPLPLAVADPEGLRRFGFHGLSCEWMVQSLGAEALGRAVLAHLGSGSSLTAVRGGKSVDTTMGLTPSGGLMMGTRTGELDPGVLLYLGRQGRDFDGLEQLVNRESGMKGVSAKTGDMKALLELREHDGAARLAVEMFCYQARKAVGALAAALGGLESLVFTGGVGERAAPVRAEICTGLEHLGVELDAARNARSEAVISTGRVRVHVLKANEERMIAEGTERVLSRPPHSL